MSLSLLEQLVSQAEAENITLAEAILRTMTGQQMREAEEEIWAAVARDRTEIEEFMSELEVASLDSYLAMDEEHLRDVFQDMTFSLSDEPLAEDEPSW